VQWPTAWRRNDGNRHERGDDAPHAKPLEAKDIAAKPEITVAVN
jgi:hypothetical protein